MVLLERLFRLRENRATVPTELRAGLATFLTLSYILFVNPRILAEAGMPPEDVAVATALGSALATLLMGLLANYPFALAPGMGLNAYFTYGVVQGMGVSWRVALAAVFAEGLLFIALSLGGIRAALVRAVPLPIKVATMSGIGLFLGLIGFESAGLVVGHPATLVGLGDLHAPRVLLALAGVALIAALMAARIRGAVLAGIAILTAVAWAAGIAPPPARWLALPALPRDTFLAFDFTGLLSGKLLAVVAAFLFVDIFDTAGTLVGVGRLGGFTDATGELPRADRAFAADAIGTAAGACLGTSTVTTYVESATGVEEGGRTGLTALAVAGLFLLSLFFAPLLAAVPAVATAPALIAVGALMMEGARDLDWKRAEVAVPAFLTLAAIPLTYSIANGISLGIVAWVVVLLFTGRWREIHPLMGVLAALLAAFHGLR